MTMQRLLERSKVQKIGKAPVVVLPLKDWNAIVEFIEEYQMTSPAYLESIETSRRQAREGALHELNLKTGGFRRVKK